MKDIQHPTLVLDELLMQRKSIVTRVVAGEVILVPVVRQLQTDAALFTLDEVAAFLWQKLEKPIKGKDLVEALVSAYDVEEGQAREDVRVFLEQLLEIEALQKAD